MRHLYRKIDHPQVFRDPDVRYILHSFIDSAISVANRYLVMVCHDVDFVAEYMKEKGEEDKNVPHRE